MILFLLPGCVVLVWFCLEIFGGKGLGLFSSVFENIRSALNGFMWFTPADNRALMPLLTDGPALLEVMGVGLLGQS